MAIIKLPNKWQPRTYQLKSWTYLENGGKRAFLVWHRRAGKDEICLHWMACAAMQKPATYWHMLPEAAQARKAIWEAINPHTGVRRIDEAFPHEIRETTREQEMVIRFVNGSTWQVIGSDNYNSIVGSPPYGVVFSEWALADPFAWAYLRPILAENGGFALFITTPRGKNHAKKMYEGAIGDPGWYVETLTVDETDVFSPEQLERELNELIRENGYEIGKAIFQQEYKCSFSAAVLGAYYGKELEDAHKQGRITVVPHDPAYPVDTAWDLGKDTHMAVWCIQTIGYQHRIIDFVTGVGALPETVKALKEKGYTWGRHYLPHDAEPEQIGTGRSLKETIQSLGLRNTVVVPQQSVADGINATRLMLPKCAFDKEKCAYGIEALENYQAEWDQRLKRLKDKPRHDWASHPADALRYFATGYTPETDEEINYSKLYGNF